MGIRERQSRETRNGFRRKILNAAPLFLNEGYANVSMRKIAEQIEYSGRHLQLLHQQGRHLLCAG